VVDLGIEFPKITACWLEKFLAALIGRALPVPEQCSV
jgi:hypothetical protein